MQAKFSRIWFFLFFLFLFASTFNFSTNKRLYQYFRLLCTCFRPKSLKHCFCLASTSPPARWAVANDEAGSRGISDACYITCIFFAGIGEHHNLQEMWQLGKFCRKIDPAGGGLCSRGGTFLKEAKMWKCFELTNCCCHTNTAHVFEFHPRRSNIFFSPLGSCIISPVAVDPPCRQRRVVQA